MQQVNCSYRCYFFDARNHIAKVEVFEATSDADALLVAGRLRDEQTIYPRVEVWDQARRVWASPSVVAMNVARVEGVENYERHAAEFEGRAARATDAAMKQLYVEMAERYRGLVREAHAKATPVELQSDDRTG